MATRATIRIIPESPREQNEEYIYLYHHWDGGPKGVGRELEHFLMSRNDSNVPDGEVKWDAGQIAHDLLNSHSGYIESNGQEGDVEYGYVINCIKRTLTCYDLDYGRRSIDNANVVKM